MLWHLGARPKKKKVKWQERNEKQRENRIEKGKKKVGIEVSFQVTTNSTIERKAGQAADRQALVHKSGYQIAYVLDGAGNFQRSSAISTICNHSDCTVAYTVAEFKVLSNWIKSVL